MTTEGEFNRRKRMDVKRPYSFNRTKKNGRLTDILRVVEARKGRRYVR